MNTHPGPIAIYFFHRLREVALAAGGEQWRQGKDRSGAVVSGPETPPAGITIDIATARENSDFEYYGGNLVCESIEPSKARYVALMSPRAALAIADQMLAAENSPLTIEQARVIRTWRVELGCTWGRVGELAEQVWGKDGGQLGGERLCAEAERLLGTTFDEENET